MEWSRERRKLTVDEWGLVQDKKLWHNMTLWVNKHRHTTKRVGNESVKVFHLWLPHVLLCLCLFFLFYSLQTRAGLHDPKSHNYPVKIPCPLLQKKNVISSNSAPVHKWIWLHHSCTKLCTCWILCNTRQSCGKLRTSARVRGQLHKHCNWY